MYQNSASMVVASFRIQGRKTDFKNRKIEAPSFRDMQRVHFVALDWITDNI